MGVEQQEIGLKWKRGWAAGWKRKNMVPWECPACGRENRYGMGKCQRCGRRAPVNANLKIEDAAAKKIQALFRSRRAKRAIIELCKQVYEKQFDSVELRWCYYNRVTGAIKYEKPRLLGVDEDIDACEETRLQAQKAIERHENERERKEAAKELIEEHKLESEKERLEKLQEDQAAIAARWDGPFKFAERTQELLASWKDFTELPERLFEERMCRNLKVVRLVGNPLRRLPEKFCTSFPRLMVLGLSNCELDCLPANIGCLVSLKELNLTKNRLKALPLSFGDLVGLEQVHLASNELESLPLTFANLKQVSRLNLEQNNLGLLPENIVELRCTSVSWSNIGLKRLPQELGRFQTLVSITANHNHIKRIPPSIGELSRLEHLSLCDNEINYIPDEICRCCQLKRLWLDWNQITELPGDFLALQSLESLQMEGNPMRVPEMEVIVQGVEHVRSWFLEMFDYVLHRDRKVILAHLQQVLQLVSSKNLVSSGWVRDECTSSEIGDKSDVYFAFPHAALYERIIPAWNEHVRESSRRMELSNAGDGENHKVPRSFRYTLEEVEDAMRNYEDAYGRVSLIGKATMQFRECRCTRNGEKRVCVPPNEEFRCERHDVSLVKAKLVSLQEKRDRESFKEEERAVKQRADEAEDRVRAHANTAQGSLMYEARAHEAAANALEEDRRNEFEERERAKLMKMKRKIDAAREAEVSRLKKSRVVRLERLEEKLKRLNALKERLKGWELRKCEDDIIDVEDEMEHLPEDVDLLRLAEEKQEGEEKFQEDLQNAKMKYKRRGELRKALETRFSPRYRQKLAEFRISLLEEDVRKARRKAIKEVRREFRITRRIMKNWTQLNIRMCFAQWRDFARTQIRWRERFRMEQVNYEELSRKSKEAGQEYRRVERAKWIEKTDPFTDMTFWEHCETREILWTEPEVESFIPRKKFDKSTLQRRRGNKK